MEWTGDCVLHFSIALELQNSVPSLPLSLQRTQIYLKRQMGEVGRDLIHGILKIEGEMEGGKKSHCQNLPFKMLPRFAWKDRSHPWQTALPMCLP